MRTPFPGMDPYLEHPVIFPDLHDSMVTYLRESVQTNLPDPYFADIGDRVWVEMVVTVPQDERREPFLEIYSRLEGERLVTIIEVLSLTNKAPGAHGRDLYLRKQKEILASQVHLVEIDLLRAGEHTTAVPLAWALPKTGRFDYHVCVHRFDNIEDYFVYPILLRQKLPEIAIPLLPGDAPVTVDLQAVFARCYDTGPYRRRVRYGEVDPEPPLEPQDREWAKDLIAGERRGR